MRIKVWLTFMLTLCLQSCVQPCLAAALESNHVYQAKITHIADGDTADADIAIGFKVHLEDVPLRFYGINTPEMKSPVPAEAVQALKAKQYVEKKILNKQVTLVFQKQSGIEKDDKYGRYLAVIYYTNRAKALINLNDELVKLGLAKEYFP